MIHWFRNALLILVTIVVGVSILVFFGSKYVTENNASKPIITASQNAIPALDALLIQIDEVNNVRRVLSCSAAGCQVNKAPESAEGDSLSDGTTWYRFATHEDKKKKQVTVLEKVKKDGSTEKISEENPLVRPREMSLSQDGTKLAYFLDNIHDKLDLTELWVYDSVEGGAKVVGENLKRLDVASRLRWNASSRVAWFLQDGVSGKQFIAVPLAGGKPAPKFSNITWNDHEESADTGIMDVNDEQNLVVFSESAFFGYSHLMVAQDGGEVTKKTIRGTVVFARWMENNALLYAVQDGSNLAFWLANNAGEKQVARMSAVFKSAHSSGSSNLAAFVADPKQGESHLYVLQISTGMVKDQTIVPQFSGTTHVVQASEAKTEVAQAVAGITSEGTDGELLAFLNTYIGKISADFTAKATRVLTTDSPNTVYVDYVGADKQEKRILVVIRDVIHADWTILARYKPSSGKWIREQEAVGADPKVRKLYEWEDSVLEWILKESY